jgi:hypothetical protein
MSFTAEQKLKAIQREISLRKHVYPNRILTKRMSKAKSDYEIAIMEAIAEDYTNTQPKGADNAEHR